VRCFVALDLPGPVRNHLHHVTQAVRSRFDVRWVGPEQMHATLVFAGELAGDGADALAAIVDEVALAPLTMQLQGFGHFPPKGTPRVLWAGLGGDVAAVTALHDALAARAEPLGVAREDRGFTPHVTLGRVKTPFGALALIDELQKLAPQLKPKPFAVPALALYASELTPRGALHTVLRRRPLPLPPAPPPAS
jgi:2'-5' RNA ligase